jgi:hypothetical protein
MIFLKWALSLTMALAISSVNAQNIIEWDKNYKLQLSDFQAMTTQVGNSNIYSLHSSSRMEVFFQMSNYEFMLSKHFNSIVKCSFTRNLASLIAPDEEIANSLLNYAQYQFDLGELYSRKLRKRLYEEKRAFSSITFFQPIYDDVQKEFVEREAFAGRETDIGREKARLTVLHEAVLEEINELSDFCKTCKPPKRKKK